MVIRTSQVMIDFLHVQIALNHRVLPRDHFPESWGALIDTSYMNYFRVTNALRKTLECPK